MRKRPIAGRTVKKREVDLTKYPRALDATHGMTMVEDLFAKLTLRGWKPAEPPKEKEGEA